MQIVISGALPDPAEARELIQYMQDTAPTLCHWLNQRQAQIHCVDPAQTLCTPLEYYQLRAANFQAGPAQHLSSGLAPLKLQQQKKTSVLGPEKPVWLAQLVHIAPSRDGAMLIPASELNITPSESEALLQSFSPYLPDTAFDFFPADTQHWQVQVPPNFQPAMPSPELVQQSNVNDWWGQDPHSRDWRRLVNEFQMFCFDHPINLARQQAGQLPINSLWLYGGALPAQLGGQPDPAISYLPQLEASFHQRSWGDWLVQLKQLDQTVLTPMRDNPPDTLVLLGRERYAQATEHKRAWPFKLFQKSQSWSRWWSPQS